MIKNSHLKLYKDTHFVIFQPLQFQFRFCKLEVTEKNVIFFMIILVALPRLFICGKNFTPKAQTFIFFNFPFNSFMQQNYDELFTQSISLFSKIL